MAFQQAHQRPQPLQAPRAVVEPAPLSPARKRSLDESQEWILFSPAQHGDGHSTTLSTQTPRTATQLSDFGSLETRVLSQRPSDSLQEGDLIHLGSEVDDDGAELDSLDDGLHAFHHPFSTSSSPLDQSGGAVLPTHDGLGTFPTPAALQEHLWQFERHNPQRRRHVTTRSSIQQTLDVLEEDEVDDEDERIARIEKWRLEQSKAVLDEIERETRRRRLRMSRTASIDSRCDPTESIAARALSRIDSTIAEEPDTTANESFWQRITRRVIQDLIGLDENTLSVIFGEQLPEDPSPTPTQPSPIALAASQESRVAFNDAAQGWESKLLERVARELGILLHQFSEHDNAFGTYLRTQQTPDYAGIPTSERQPRPISVPRQRRRNTDTPTKAPSDSLFMPTLQRSTTDPSDASVWGVEKEATDDETISTQHQREYWEQDIDVKMIFSYLKTRFASDSNSKPSPSPPGGPLPAAWTTSVVSALGNTPESLRRAEVIRRQHPLVSRATERAVQQVTRRDSLRRRHHMQNLMHKRAGSSSCASQSTKRSRRSKSGSSRHYWDLGGSVGSGSGPALSSGLGGWGEV